MQLAISSSSSPIHPDIVYPHDDHDEDDDEEWIPDFE
jgi:hypothetical protein